MGKKGIKVIAYRPVAKTSITEIGNLPDTGAAEYLERLKNSFILKQRYMDEGSRIDVDFNVFGKGFRYQSIIPGGPEVPVAGVVRKVDVRVDGELGLQSGVWISAYETPSSSGPRTIRWPRLQPSSPATTRL